MNTLRVVEKAIELFQKTPSLKKSFITYSITLSLLGIAIGVASALYSSYALFLFLPFLFIFGSCMTLLDVKSAYEIGARIQGHKVTPKEVHAYCISHLGSVMILTVVRFILAPIAIIERLFAPLGKVGSILVRPFEYIFGSLWTLVSAFTPHTFVFHGNPGTLYRKTVMTIRKKRGRHLRLRSVWLVYLVLFFIGVFFTLLIYVAQPYPIILLVVTAVAVIIWTVAYIFYRSLLSLWRTAMYFYLVTGKILPPFDKHDVGSSVLYRISK